MSDLIDRQAAIDAIRNAVTKECAEWVVRELPSVETKRKKGKWIDTGSGERCSVCDEIQYGYDNYRFYCPNCGADMRGTENE